ncbi:tripartite tricarboxylate transporter substrate binding protein [Hydrogenophaga sp. 2FB]|uniref:Bug family tripartite tricarboxylate transporter substrate binding protein n=1 Tax=Hydrogenophaga sp. 2FB TaxID=2502187 RepID=UPI0014851705|nr:tripartite tricarboxylate transporter substrate binding protein [Hydrogenophaga sp. 2FB]
MKLNRRHTATAAVLAGLLASGGFSTQALAQAYPEKPIRLVVAFSTGSGNDTIARELGRHMGDILGQPVVVENRAGGGGSIGTDVVAKAAPDGYTIGLGTSSQLVMNVGLYPKLPFDVEKDLRSIGLVSRTPLVLVASTSTPKTLKELIAHAKSHPGKISYGSGGKGSISHVVGENFAKAADISLLHVPYKGNGAALIDLSGGHVNLLFDGLISASPLEKQGLARLLAVSGNQRSAVEPNVPTFAELGMPTFDAYTWNNLMAPAKTPQAVIDKLNAALNKALAMPDMKARLAQGASESLGPTTPAQADAFGQAERAKWVPFILALRIDLN